MRARRPPRAWIESSTPTRGEVQIIAEPPTETNGSGMPVIGAMPIVMPTLTKIWNEEREDDPGGNDRAVEVSGSRDDLQPSPDDEQVEQQSTDAPRNPRCSAREANAKSVACAGR